MNLSAVEVALVPTAVVTVMSTMPEPGGDTAIISVCVPFGKNVHDSAGVPPKLTPVTFARFVPMTVTLVSPLGGPQSGVTPFTAGSPV